MDERIRRLERSDDPEQQLRAGRLRCKVEGHVMTPFKDVVHHQDHQGMSIVFTLRLEDMRCITIPLRDHVMFSLLYGRHTEREEQELERFRYDLAHASMQLAKCNRCGEDNGLEETYLRDIQHELTRALS